MFYSEQQFTDLHSRMGGLSIISLNILSIHSNYTKLELLIERLIENNPSTVICLNECWLEFIQNMIDLQLKRGFIIYVYNQFSAKPLDINENSHGWETVY